MSNAQVLPGGPWGYSSSIETAKERKTPMKTVFTLLLIACALTAGCQSHRGERIKFDLQMRQITIETTPAGASVYVVNGVDGSSSLLGTSPCREQTVPVMTSLRFSGVSPARMQELLLLPNMVPVVIKKDGYQDYVGKLSTQDGKTTVHSIELERKQPATQPAS